MRADAIAVYEFMMQAVFSLPRLRICNALKASYMRLLGARVGVRPVFYPGIWIMPLKGLVIGDDVDLARGVLITTSGGVSIGDRTLVGYGARILSSNHRVGSNGGVFGNGHRHEAVRIGSDVWIGAGATILPGVEIGDGAVIAAGAVVTRDVGSRTTVAGVPARCVAARLRKSE
ncbi:MAG TPA: acyltransferase [Marmoricola sp.]|nr:acyltransferase [Marmoricola sp.]